LLKNKRQLKTGYIVDTRHPNGSLAPEKDYYIGHRYASLIALLHICASVTVLILPTTLIHEYQKPAVTAIHYYKMISFKGIKRKRG
jgi:hypothetical protein